MANQRILTDITNLSIIGQINTPSRPVDYTPSIHGREDTNINEQSLDEGIPIARVDLSYEIEEPYEFEGPARVSLRVGETIDTVRRANRAKYMREWRARQKAKKLGAQESEEVGEIVELNKAAKRGRQQKERRALKKATTSIPIVVEECEHAIRELPIVEDILQPPQLPVLNQYLPSPTLPVPLFRRSLRDEQMLARAEGQKNRRARINDHLENIVEENMLPVTRLGSSSRGPSHDEDVTLPPQILINPPCRTSHVPRLPTFNLARNHIFHEDHVFQLKLRGQIDLESGRHYLGRMNVICPSCKALHWSGEKVSSTKFKDSPFGKCCNHGRVDLPPLRSLPPLLATLVSGEGQASKKFLSLIRAYNSALQHASTGANMMGEVYGGIKHLRIQGGIYHSIGPLYPDEGQPPKFAQLYIYDTEHEIENRGRVITDGIDLETLRGLQNVMRDHNAHVRSFQAIACEVGSENARIILRASEKGLDARRYNLPVASEVAAIIPGDGSEEIGPRDIIVYLRGGGVRRISDLNQAYIPLHFVLLFPYGEAGWHIGILKRKSFAQEDNVAMDSEESVVQNILHNRADDNIVDHDAHANTGTRHVTPLEFASFRLHTREDNLIGCMDGSRLTRFDRLYQEYMVDVYATIENLRLSYIRTHQPQLRAHLYQGVRDAVTRHDHDAADIGRRIILPSSFVGGPRHMHQLFQDAMAIVRHFGKPDYFLTMTCNPAWKEITDELTCNNQVNRSDLIARVFEQRRRHC